MRSKAFYVLPKGYTQTPLYRAYHDMIDRCYKPQKSNYKYYGGKGVKVCEEWKIEYLSFYEWSIVNGYKEGFQIDRIDVNGDYTPKNCRWVDKITQENNKTTNVRITYSGETHTVAEWARKKGFKPHTIRNRLRKGWDVKRALETPTRGNG